MFIMYNILSTFIIPMKGISNQTSDLLFSFKISYLFIKIQGVMLIIRTPFAFTYNNLFLIFYHLNANEVVFVITLLKKSYNHSHF